MPKQKLHHIAVGLALTACLAAPGLASASDLVRFKTVFDTDFATAGAGGMRGNGVGTINLSGVSGPVSEAYLFWHGPTNAASTDTSANANVTFNGTAVTGDFLGISENNCWGFENSMAYRANVTSLVSGSGAYSLSDFVKPGVDVNGASLIVFYDDGDTINNRDVVMFNGNDSNIDNVFDAPGWNITLNGIDYSAGDANMQLHVSDGQSFTEDALVVNSTIIAPAGPIFQGDADPLITNGAFNSNGALWDINNYNVTSLLNPGLNNLNFTTGVSADCLSCVLIAIDLPAGAAPEQPGPRPAVPEPISLALMGLGLMGLGATRLRRKTAA